MEEQVEDRSDAKENKKMSLKDRMALPVPNAIVLAREEGQDRTGSLVVVAALCVLAAALLAASPFVPAFGGMELPHHGFAHIVVLSAVAVGSACYVRFKERRSDRSMGFAQNDAAATFIYGAIIGAVGSLIAFWLIKTAGFIESSDIRPQVPALSLLLTVMGYFILALMQEIFCRGFVMTTLAARYSVFVGMAVQTVVFAAMHALILGPSVFSVVNGLLMGVLFGLMFLKFGSIWPAVGFHCTWYVVQYVILGIASDASSAAFGSVFVTVYDSSNALLSGGLGGFEASAFSAIAYALFIVVFLLMKPHDADLESIASVDLGEGNILGKKDEEKIEDEEADDESVSDEADDGEGSAACGLPEEGEGDCHGSQLEKACEKADDAENQPR